jgi:hypothetical protein
MATYAELHQALGNATFRERVAIAVLDIAEDFITDHVVSTADQLRWANRLIRRPPDLLDTITNQLVAQNAALTLAQITGATDEQIKTGVLTAIAALIASENKANT